MRQPAPHQHHSDDDATSPRRYLTGPDVCRRYGISNMTLWRWLDDPAIAFPKPTLRVRERRYWDEQTLIDWERSYVPHGDAAAPAKKRSRHRAVSTSPPTTTSST